MSTSFTIAGVRTSTPIMVTGYEATREVRNVFNPVLGAMSTVAVAFPAGLRSGTLTAVFVTQYQAAELDSMLSGTSVLRYVDTDVANVSMYFLADQSIRVYPADQPVDLADGTTVLPWFVEFGYQEVTL